MTPQVVLIGDADRAEMLPIVEWLKQRCLFTAVVCRRSIPADLSWRTFDRQPDLIVVLEAHPDEYTVDEVAALFAAAPLSRMVCCAGAWSESAGRNRRIWPFAVRVAVPVAIPRLEQEWRLLSAENAAYCLPPTGSREEWFAAHHPALSFSETFLGHRIAIVSPDSAYRQWLMDWVTIAGGTVMFDEQSPVDVLLWDADPWSATRGDELRRRVATWPDVVVVALSNWVLPTMEAELLRAGAAGVVTKLGDVERISRVIREFPATLSPGFGGE